MQERHDESPARSRVPRVASWVLATSAGVVGAAGGCASYEPDPLTAGHFEAVVADRDSVLGSDEAPQGPVNLAEATEWLRTRSPAVRDAVAAYATAAARARVPTPWPNPTLQLGPIWGFGADVDKIPVVPFAGLQLQIPLGDRIEDADALDAARVDAARAETLATLRETYLGLRAAWVAFAVAVERETVQDELVDGARRAVEVGDRLVGAGAAGALDATVFRLDRARAEAERAAARLARADAVADLGDLLAVPPEGLDERLEPRLPDLPEALPERDVLYSLVLAENPRLLRLRAEHAVAERALRLEVSKQIPDLQLNPYASGEPGEYRTNLGLQIGLRLPLFDRNQKAIATAAARRDEVARRYHGEAHRVLGAVDRARLRVVHAAERLTVLRDDVVPLAERNLRAAERALEAGAAGALRIVDARRSVGEVRAELVEARLAAQLAWVGLERAVGFPLTRFAPDDGRPADGAPSDGASPRPDAPPALPDELVVDREAPPASVNTDAEADADATTRTP